MVHFAKSLSLLQRPLIMSSTDFTVEIAANGPYKKDAKIMRAIYFMVLIKFK